MLYVIGDLHLSFSVDKKMDTFGGDWENYEEKLEKSLKSLSEDDVIVLAGDTSWGMTLEESLADFVFLNNLPGKKIILKGNHDYWWQTSAKMNRFFFDKDLNKLKILHNNAFLFGNLAVCGTRGWFYEESGSQKVMEREVGRLRKSLEEGRNLTNGELIVVLHYPPLYEGYRCDPLVDLMNEFEIKRCYYGHLHGYSFNKAIVGVYKGIDYHLISADFLKFSPKLCEE